MKSSHICGLNLKKILNSVLFNQTHLNIPWLFEMLSDLWFVLTWILHDQGTEFHPNLTTKLLPLTQKNAKITSM